MADELAENKTGKRVVQINWTDRVMQLGERLGRVVYTNRRLFEGKAFKWTALIHHEGYCMSPTIQTGDASIIALEVPVQDGDIVAYNKEGKLHCAWYRSDGQNAWLEASIETACDKIPLEGCSIIGVVVINARFSRLPYYMINPDQTPQCQDCPTVLRLLDIIGLLCRDLNLDPGSVLFHYQQMARQQVGNNTP
jgi:hypothetical protein